MEPTRSWLAQTTLFAKNFVQHPKMLGSIIPSSRFLIRRVLRQMDFGRARVVVEYGPGVGTFTRELLQRMPADATLIALDTNPEFVEFLRRTIRDKRLHVVRGSAADVEKVLRDRGLDRADYVISGIPLSTIPEGVRQQVLQATRRVLATDGAFLVYQFSPKSLPDLQREFPRVQRGFEPLNILPAQLFFCSV